MDFSNPRLQAFHNVAGVDIVFSENVDSLASEMIDQLMSDKVLKKDLPDLSDYQGALLCRAIQCGAVIAHVFAQNAGAITNKRLMKSIAKDPEEYMASVNLTVLKISPENFYLGLCQAIVHNYTVGPHSADASEDFYDAMKCAFTVGASLSLNAHGY